MDQFGFLRAQDSSQAGTYTVPLSVDRRDQPQTFECSGHILEIDEFTSGIAEVCLVTDAPGSFVEARRGTRIMTGAPFRGISVKNIAQQNAFLVFRTSAGYFRNVAMPSDSDQYAHATTVAGRLQFLAASSLDFGFLQDPASYSPGARWMRIVGSARYYAPNTDTIGASLVFIFMDGHRYTYIPSMTNGFLDGTDYHYITTFDTWVPYVPKSGPYLRNPPGGVQIRAQTVSGFTCNIDGYLNIRASFQ